MPSIQDKMLREAMQADHAKGTNEGSQPMIIPRSEETSLTSKDDDKLKEIIINEYSRRGINPAELSLLSTSAIVTNGLIYAYERVSEILAVQKRESSILTAQKSVTLYNQLIQHTDNITLSKPSNIDVFVKIPFNDLERYGKHEGNGKWKFIYTTDNTIILDDIPFVPKYDIEVLLTKTKNKQEIKIQYQTYDGYKIIPSQRILDSNEYYYGVFKVPFTQLTIVKQERTFSGKQIEKYIINTENPIHDFVLSYKDSSMTVPKKLEAKLFFTRGAEEYLKYDIHDNKKITIHYTFTPSGFKPVAGGKLYITMLTTTGRNIRYRGDATISKRVPDDLTVEYSPVSTEYVSTGGSLASDDKEYLRKYIIKQKGTRLRIDTDTDLRTYLSTYSGKSQFMPRLVVSDLKRVFNVYTLMSFENNGNIFTVPTTSGDILFPLSRLDKRMIDGTPYYNLLGSNIESIQGLGVNRYYLAPEVPTTPSEGESKFNFMLPFHITYNEKSNFIRCLLESQYNIPYDTYCEYDSDDINVPTRYVNTTLRVNDYEIDNNQRVFSISTQIRSDMETFKLNTNNFDAYLYLTTKDEREARIKYTSLTDLEKDNKYNIEFEIKSNRKVYDRYFDIELEVKNKSGDWVAETTLFDIHQKNMILELYAKPEGDNATMILVTKYKSSVSIFKDVTKFLYLQSVVTFAGDLKLILCPMVEKEFGDNWRNRIMINNEMDRICQFIDSEVYDSNNEYSSSGYSLKDRQETLFTTSIKFTKTYGRSKFLQVGEMQLLENLQVSPSFKVRLLNEQFDISSVSSDTNKFLTTHDFQSSDLHMNRLVKEVLSNNSETISMLQFSTFGPQYDDSSLMIFHNDLTFTNQDVPESVSLKPKWNESLGIYNYDVAYSNI